MNDKPKGLSFVIGLFGSLSLLLFSLALWHILGQPTPYAQATEVNVNWLGLSLLVASILLLSAWSLHTTKTPLAWTFALLLNFLLLGSVVILPLLIVSAHILLKRNTREHFGVNFNKRAPTIA